MIKNNCSTTKKKKMEIPKVVEIKSVFIEHPKTSHKLSKTITQAKKVGAVKNSDCPLHSETKKVKIL